MQLEVISPSLHMPFQIYVFEVHPQFSPYFPKGWQQTQGKAQELGSWKEVLVFDEISC